MELQADEARLLLNAAMLAAGWNRFGIAEGILSALERFRPGAEALDVARVVILLNRRQFADAVLFIDSQGLKRHPASGMLTALRGLALIHQGKRKAAIGCLKSASESGDSAAADIAKGLMNVRDYGN